MYSLRRKIQISALILIFVFVTLREYNSTSVYAANVGSCACRPQCNCTPAKSCGCLKNHVSFAADFKVKPVKPAKPELKVVKAVLTNDSFIVLTNDFPQPKVELKATPKKVNITSQKSASACANGSCPVSSSRFRIFSR